jgi:DNA-binding response OmpR family regulator
MEQEILVCGRHKALYGRLEQLLSHEQYRLKCCTDLDQTQSSLERGVYRYVLLEYRISSLRRVMAFIRLIRTHHPQISLIVLAEPKHSVEDRIVALENGVDDFIDLEVDPRELAARVRRFRLKTPTVMVESESDPMYRFGGFTLDVRNRRVSFLEDGDLILTWHEFELLLCLLENSGHAVSRHTLACRVHGRVWHYEERSLDVMVSILRGKLKALVPDQRFIHTIRGVGYYFRGLIKPAMRGEFRHEVISDKSYR